MSYAHPGTLGDRELSFRNDRVRFHCIFSFPTQANLCFLDVLIKECYHLCPNMIDFNALDLSECRSEKWQT